MSDVEIEEDNRNTLIGFHAFTRCDSTSSFFGKGKTTSWKKMNSKSRFKEVMTRLGENDSVDDDLCRTLDEFVCTMYGGGRAEDVSTLRFNKFTEKQKRENKYVDLSTLPPCQATLKLHTFRANRVAYLMKRSSVAQVEEPPLSDCGWDHEGRITQIEETYPSAVEELLVESHNTDESVKEDFDEYFKDNCMGDEHD